ncbi:hypothetical protein [Amaricoccus sp.]|uniref:hypothetical protein n=1 Tax=Amaricoccus sp. TaxID=1872485 RepID=UPI001B7BA90A|nr:hypothetical protein [Amaricoccus sp.]MBP7240987.1 hypothetical protein [Amaricoccus sp.]
MRRGGKSGQQAEMDLFEAARLGLASSASRISDLILDAAVAKLDALFGPGFAKANPALVGQYLDATTRTFQNDMATVAELDDLDDLDLDLALTDPDRRR